MGRLPIQLLLAGFVIAGNGPLLAANKKTAAQAPVRAERPVQKSADGAAEARLIEIYKLIGQSQSR